LLAKSINLAAPLLRTKTATDMLKFEVHPIPLVMAASKKSF
jgi:hypothetical protein